MIIPYLEGKTKFWKGVANVLRVTEQNLNLA